ncbi:MAG: DUF885 family protein, partial [Proteobacteria bacterium]|nr:DUF885 family protein [Pseudomonadota bacterium]
MRLARLALAVAIAAVVPTLHAAPAKTAHAPAASNAKAKQLDTLYAQYWNESLKLNPLSATYQGDNRYNDQLPDFYSAAFRKQNHDFTARWLKKIESVGSAGLTGQARISYDIFVHDSKESLEGEKYPGWMMPVDQMGSIATMAAQLGSGTGAQPFKTVKDYDNWLKRGRRIPVLVDSIITDMQAGVKAGVVQPRALMTKVVPQYDAIIKDKPEDSVFWGPIKQMPASFSAADKTRLTKAYQAMIASDIMPAFRKLRGYIANDYLPKTRDSVGLDKLPNGAAWYAFNVRQTTTTDLTPAQIHELGLSEVDRIHGEMQQVMKDVGFKGSLQDFFKFMREDKQFQFKSED